jgi:sugar O-acyltransferase (sialic acid O-acetyltransferase NeuD family)
MRIIDQFVLWGSAGHAKVLADLIKLQGGVVVAVFDNNEGAASCLADVPIFYGEAGLEKWLKDQPLPININAALAIGGAKGKERHEIAMLLARAGLSLPILIHKSAVVSGTALLGRGVQILANSVVAAEVVLGEVCIINNSVNIDHECNLGKGVHVAPGSVLCGCITVGDYSLIGAGSVVLPRINIGKNVIIGAGSVVTHNVPDNVIVAGNPAKLIRSLE